MQHRSRRRRSGQYVWWSRVFPGFLAVCGAFEINYYDVPGSMPGRQNVSYYQAGMESRFMTSDSNGTLYIPFAYLASVTDLLQPLSSCPLASEAYR